MIANLIWLIGFILILNVDCIEINAAIFKVTKAMSIDTNYDDSLLLMKYNNFKRSRCLNLCITEPSCYILIIPIDKSCKFYNQSAVSYLINDPKATLYEIELPSTPSESITTSLPTEASTSTPSIETSSTSTTIEISSITSTTIATTINDGLIAYWPVSNDSYTTPSSCSLSLLVPNRLGLSDEALYLKNENCDIGSLHGIDDQFTLMTWINPQSPFKNITTILAMGNDPFPNDYIVFSIYPNGVAFLDLYSRTDLVAHIQSDKIVPVNSWTHLAVTLEVNSLKMFVNGSLESSEDDFPAFNITTSRNNFYIGQYFSENQEEGFLVVADLDAYLDEMRIYNRTLSDDEITIQYSANL